VFNKIIVGHDLHGGGDDALAFGRVLAEATGAELVVAGIFPLHSLPARFERRWKTEEREVAAKLQAVADRAGACAEAFPSTSPARGLHELAEEIGGDLIVAGSSRHGPVGHALAGDVGQALLHGSPCAIAITPRRYHEELKAALGTIVVGVDGSAEAEQALLDGIDLARASGAALKLLAVAEPPFVGYGKGAGPRQGWQELKATIEQMMRERLDATVASIPEDVTCEATLIIGEPAEALVDASREPGSVLVLGSRAYGPARRVLLGSVSNALVRCAPCPLIVHPRGASLHAGDAQRAGSGGAA
jgi:nucleotide-binding universal stress UspA family protein